MKALLRRKRVGSKLPNRIEVGNFVLDIDTYQLEIDGVASPIHGKEFQIIYLLLQNAGKAITRKELIQNLWGGDYTSNTLEVHISKLRNRLGEYANRLVTVRGVGYRFDKA